MRGSSANSFVGYRCKKAKAFTLVELLTTIAIAAILVSIIVPMVGNYVSEARRTADQQTLTVLNDAINRYKMQGGNVNALTVDKPFSNLITMLQTPVSWNGLTHQFIKDSDDFPGALTIDVAGSGRSYKLTRYNTYDAGGGSNIVAGGNDTTSDEFNIAGATYYAVAPAGYSYSAWQTTNYSTRKYNTLATAEAALPATATTPLVINILGTWGSADTSNVGFEGVTTSASNYILVRTIGSARHNGLWSNSVYRLMDSDDWGPALYSEIDFIRFEGLLIRNTSANSAAQGVYLTPSDGAPTGVVLKDCIVDGNQADGIHVRKGYPVTLINCVVSNNGSNGIRMYSAGIGETYAYNCVAVKNGGYGMTCDGYRTFEAYNCYAGGNTGADYFWDPNADTAGPTNSYSEDGTEGTSTAPFTTATFVSVSGTGDFHLANGSALEGAGADLSGSFTTDIDGETRTVPWSIGVDQ